MLVLAKNICVKIGMCMNTVNVYLVEKHYCTFQDRGAKCDNFRNPNPEPMNQEFNFKTSVRAFYLCFVTDTISLITVTIFG